jgi:hypothetical protein
VIPLRDDVPSRTVPIVNYVVIALNVIAFVLELGLGDQRPRFLAQASVVHRGVCGRRGADQTARWGGRRRPAVRDEWWQDARV